MHRPLSLPIVSAALVIGAAATAHVAPSGIIAILIG